MATYTGFMKAVAKEVAEFTERRVEAAAREGARESVFLQEWLAQKEKEHKASGGGNDKVASNDVEQSSDCECIRSSMSASVWKIKCQVGQTIQSADDVMIVLEAMKTEINVPAGEEIVGKVVRGLAKGIHEGASVQAGDPLVWVC